MAVVDASIVVRLLQNRRADGALRARIGSLPELHAPTLIDAEVTSAVRGLLLSSGPVSIDAARAAEMIADYADLRMLRYPVVPLQARVLELRHNFTAYDACYVALAEALGRPLLTSDAKFSRAPGSSVAIESWQ